MNCDAARELIGADPQASSPELDAHLSTCAACKAYRQEMQAFDARLRRALAFDPRPLQQVVQSDAAVRTSQPAAPASRRRRSRGLAWVTSLAAGLLIASGLWLSRPSQTLASEIVTHVEGEPNSWFSTDLVSSAQLAAVLNKAGVKLGPGLGPVVYANSCWFRGHFVPHLVVTTRSGPVTIMILMHERVRNEQTFREDGLNGLLVPASNGAVAILSRTPMALEPPAREVLRALENVSAANSSGILPNAEGAQRVGSIGLPSRL